jgi:MerR family transcriptional regulator, light-induced transcriptional regulator
MTSWHTEPRLRAPSGAQPPTSVRLPGGEIDLEPIAREACRRYRQEYPDEQRRYGQAGDTWCLHDTLYLLAWAADDLRLGETQLAGNVRWLASVLDARRFPVERLARHLQIAAEVVLDAGFPDAGPVAQQLHHAGTNVVADISSEHPPASSPVRDAYLAALLGADPYGARLIVEAALEAGMPVGELYLSVFQEALYEVGRLWQTGEATVAQEHLATATTQTLIARLPAPPLATPRPERRAITTATQTELHALGPRFLADFLEREGWTVIDLGADTPTEDLVRFVAHIKPTLVCLSTTLTTNLTHAQDAITALRKLSDPPLIAVGGHAYQNNELLATTLGADLHALDAATFLQTLRARLADPDRS